MKLLERLDQQIIDRKPNRAAPVGIAAEQIRLRFRRLVADDLFFAAHRQDVGMLLVKFADGTHAIIAQEFFGIEHASQQTFHAVTTREGNEASFAHPRFLPARNQTGEIGAMHQIPLESCLEAG